MAAGFCCRCLSCLHTLRAALAIWVAGCVASIFCTRDVFVVAFKIVKGVGVGLSSVAGPLYAFEVLAPQSRPLAIGVFCVGAVLGPALIFASAAIMKPHVGPQAAFHYTWISECIYGLVALLCCCFLPQLPRALALRGNWPRAAKTMGRLTPVPPTLTQTHFAFALLFDCSLAGHVAAAAAAHVLSRAAVSFSSTHYAHYTLAFCRLPTHTVEALYACMLAMSLVLALVACCFLRLARRKDALVFGLFVCAAAFAAMAVSSHVGAESGPAAALAWFPFAPAQAVSHIFASLVLALALLAVSVLALLLLAFSWLYALEVLPPSARALGLLVALFCGWTVDAAVLAAGPVLSMVHPKIVFAAFSGVFALGVLMFLWVPETKYAAASEGLPYPLTKAGLPEAGNQPDVIGLHDVSGSPENLRPLSPKAPNSSPLDPAPPKAAPPSVLPPNAPTPSLSFYEDSPALSARARLPQTSPVDLQMQTAFTRTQDSRRASYNLQYQTAASSEFYGPE